MIHADIDNTYRNSDRMKINEMTIEDFLNHAALLKAERIGIGIMDLIRDVVDLHNFDMEELTECEHVIFEMYDKGYDLVIEEVHDGSVIIELKMGEKVVGIRRVT